MIAFEIDATRLGRLNAIDESLTVATVPAFERVARGQMLASRGLGMSYAMAMRRIILPQALRRTLPPLISGFVDILKGTALVSLIGFPDLMYQAGQANSHSYRSVEIFTAAALGYFIIACPLSVLARSYEKGLLARQG